MVLRYNYQMAQSGEKNADALKILALQMSYEIDRLKKECLEARRIFRTVINEYDETECYCNFDDNFHCAKCRIIEWVEKYELVRKKKI